MKLKLQSPYDISKAFGAVGHSGIYQRNSEFLFSRVFIKFAQHHADNFQNGSNLVTIDTSYMVHYSVLYIYIYIYIYTDTYIYA